jgi:hypothetical protein
MANMWHRIYSALHVKENARFRLPAAKLWQTGLTVKNNKIFSDENE